ncbi:MAG: PbpA [Desulfobacterales bacterium]|nr:PbpA [Desulfobacterales bacterium]
MHTFKDDNSWRRHQSDFFLDQRKKKRKGRIFKILLALVLLIGISFSFKPALHKGKELISWVSAMVAPGDLPDPLIHKSPTLLTIGQAREQIKELPVLNASRNVFFLDTPEQSLRVNTSLDPELMEYLNSVQEKLKRLTRGKPRQLAIVVMDGHTGQFKAMAGFDLENPDANPVAQDIYPAASLFKIVTATAAIDALGYSPLTPVFFNGNKYTLYKRQLKNTRNKYTSKTTLARAFAESINPVFGKLGQNELGRERLDQYAEAFGFSQELNSDLEFPSGNFATTQSKYHLAELGCGFNQQTTISPIFAAVMVTAVLNQGHSRVPTLVDQITTAMDETIYKREQAVYKTAMKPETADAMIALMQKTISSGTARKSFRRISRDKVLSQLIIGGKTGSLYNREHIIKYDWFTGFGKTRSGNESVALAVLVGHGKYIGTRAATHARSILRKYFEPRLAKADAPNT